MSTLHRGRSNTAAIGAVYASREPATAVEELRRRAVRDGTWLVAMHPRSLFVLDILLHAVVDLTKPDALAAWGLTVEDLMSDDFTRCQEVMAITAQHGAEAIR